MGVLPHTRRLRYRRTADKGGDIQKAWIVFVLGEGIDLSRQTTSGWVIHLHERLSPLMAAMKRLLHVGRVIHIDETRF